MQYEFQKEDAYRFRDHVRARTKERGEELIFAYCPQCQGGKKRDRDTFSINLRTGLFECKRASCGAKGNMLTLARDFDFSLGNDYDRYYQPEKFQYRKLPSKPIESKPPAVAYMRSRGISEEITKRYQITVKTDQPNILVFPFYDEKGEMVYVKYRKTDFQKGRDQNKEWCEASCRPILFGMDQCDMEHKTLVMTEGQIDSLSVAESGIKNAVSVPNGKNGFTWVPHCWDWLTKFETLIVFGDFERGSMSLLEDMRRRFPGQVRAVRQEDYRGCKDANELLQKHGREVVRDAVNRAELVPIKQIKRLADVEAVDLYSLERLRTNIPEIDSLLGGLYFGQLVLLTGPRGDGKSTFLSQLTAEALDQNYPCFIYSGEMMAHFVKRCIDYQLAGPNIRTEFGTDGKERHLMPEKAQAAINEWYRDKAFIFDNGCIEDDEKDDLLTIVEKAIQQYGVKLVCIDNLMVALDISTGEDLYRAQSRFVGKLAKLAQLHNVLIILVAHPRKIGNSTGEITNDDISGSSDVTNKVDVIMQYFRPSESRIPSEMPPENLRCFRVTKNRLTGKLTRKGQEISLYYNERNKRIVGQGQDFSRVYGYVNDGNGFADIEPADTPFEQEDLVFD